MVLSVERTNERTNEDKKRQLVDSCCSCCAVLQAIFKKIATSTSKPSPRVSIESGNYNFHYYIDSDVVYMTLTDKQYPRKLAFQYLDELSKEFTSLYGDQVESITRPYAFIKFDTFIQKTKKLYLDTRTQRNISRLNADLAEVHSIMTKNIQDVLGQGERLDREFFFLLGIIILHMGLTGAIKKNNNKSTTIIMCRYD